MLHHLSTVNIIQCSHKAESHNYREKYRNDYKTSKKKEPLYYEMLWMFYLQLDVLRKFSYFFLSILVL